MSDFNAVLEQLAPWSLFKLNRLNCAILKLLEDPDRIEAIKRELNVGMHITYFCRDTNKLVEATIEEIRKTWASVINRDDGKKWNIKFFLINLEGIDTNITPKKRAFGLDRNSLKVGDHVGWSSKLGHDLYGVVEKLNPKKALVRLGNGDQWRVPYALLFSVLDGQASTQRAPLCIEGEVIHSS